MSGRAPRLGIYGGSFDPIHLGHLRAAEEVREALELDHVLFVPAANPPHKPTRRLADGSARRTMIELAIADHPGFAVSSIELERGGLSYSIDTITDVGRLEPDAELFFLLGLDAWREIHLWKEVERMFERANLVVVRRPPAPLDVSIEHLPIAAQEAFCYGADRRIYRHRSGTSLTFLSITGLDVSATRVRATLRERHSVRYLVPAAVDRYLADTGLYSSGEQIG